MSLPSEINSILLRDVEDVSEIRALEDLQIKVWGDGERDIVPLSQLIAARYVGGTLIGAFDDKKLVGFAYGFYGHVAGRLVHHSHMLAVDPAYRDHNLGFRLKAAQRERVLAANITNRMTWTFDPLQSLNAHFNFAKLGVLSDTYKINVYGEEAASFLHQNGTDRLFVTWLLDRPRVEDLVTRGEGTRGPRTDSGREPLLLLRNSDSGRPEPAAGFEEIAEVNLAAVEIPSDINSVERTDIGTARQWRGETRRVFTEALSKGFVIVDYFLKDERSGTYLLKRSSLDEAFE